MIQGFLDDSNEFDGNSFPSDVLQDLTSFYSMGLKNYVMFKEKGER